MTTTSAILIQHHRLREVARAVVRATESSEAEAAEVADHLVEANLKGHDSHGVGMLPTYVQNYRDGYLVSNRHARMVGREGAVATFTGEMGYGQVIAREVMDWAVERAKSGGVAIAALRETHHIGRVGTYGEHACRSGMISVTFVSALTGAPFVAPFRGSDGRMSTNPICIAIPGKDPEEPIVLDFATSVVAMGKVRVAYNEGKPMPPGMLIDKEGHPTDDPGVLWPDRSQGAILPFGLHKGYGLAVVCELLAGALTGNGTYRAGHEASPAIKNAMLAIVFDPKRISEGAPFYDDVAAFVDYAKASPPANPDEPVLVAGDPERIMKARRTAEGIPVDGTTWAQIRASAEALGVSGKHIEELAHV